MLRQMYDDVEDFSREVKNAKVQKVFFKIDTAQQPIRAPVKKTLPDGTQEDAEVEGIRLTASIIISAVTPQVVDEKQTQLERQMILAGNPIQFLHATTLVVKDCFEDADFNAFAEEVKVAKETVLGNVQKIANVLLFMGTVGPVGE
jgi:hypothetical protein